MLTKHVINSATLTGTITLIGTSDLKSLNPCLQSLPLKSEKLVVSVMLQSPVGLLLGTKEMVP